MSKYGEANPIGQAGNTITFGKNQEFCTSSQRQTLKPSLRAVGKIKTETYCRVSRSHWSVE